MKNKINILENITMSSGILFPDVLIKEFEESVYFSTIVRKEVKGTWYLIPVHGAYSKDGLDVGLFLKKEIMDSYQRFISDVYRVIVSDIDHISPDNEDEFYIGESEEERITEEDVFGEIGWDDLQDN